MNADKLKSRWNPQSKDSDPATKIKPNFRSGVPKKDTGPAKPSWTKPSSGNPTKNTGQAKASWGKPSSSLSKNETKSNVQNVPKKSWGKPSSSLPKNAAISKVQEIPEIGAIQDEASGTKASSSLSEDAKTTNAEKDSIEVGSTGDAEAKIQSKEINDDGSITMKGSMGITPFDEKSGTPFDEISGTPFDEKSGTPLDVQPSLSVAPSNNSEAQNSTAFGNKGINQVDKPKALWSKPSASKNGAVGKVKPNFRSGIPKKDKGQAKASWAKPSYSLSKNANGSKFQNSAKKDNKQGKASWAKPSSSLSKNTINSKFQNTPKKSTGQAKARWAKLSSNLSKVVAESSQKETPESGAKDTIRTGQESVADKSASKEPPAATSFAEDPTMSESKPSNSFAEDPTMSESKPLNSVAEDPTVSESKPLNEKLTHSTVEETDKKNATATAEKESAPISKWKVPTVGKTSNSTVNNRTGPRKKFAMPAWSKPDTNIVTDQNDPKPGTNIPKSSYGVKGTANRKKLKTPAAWAKPKAGTSGAKTKRTFKYQKAPQVKKEELQDQSDEIRAGDKGIAVKTSAISDANKSRGDEEKIEASENASRNKNPIADDIANKRPLDGNMPSEVTKKKHTEKHPQESSKNAISIEEEERHKLEEEIKIIQAMLAEKLQLEAEIKMIEAMVAASLEKEARVAAATTAAAPNAGVPDETNVKNNTNSRGSLLDAIAAAGNKKRRPVEINKPAPQLKTRGVSIADAAAAAAAKRTATASSARVPDEKNVKNNTNSRESLLDAITAAGNKKRRPVEINKPAPQLKTQGVSIADAAAAAAARRKNNPIQLNKPARKMKIGGATPDLILNSDGEMIRPNLLSISDAAAFHARRRTQKLMSAEADFKMTDHILYQYNEGAETDRFVIQGGQMVAASGEQEGNGLQVKKARLTGSRPKPRSGVAKGGMGDLAQQAQAAMAARQKRLKG